MNTGTYLLLLNLRLKANHNQKFSGCFVYKGCCMLLLFPAQNTQTFACTTYNKNIAQKASENK